MARSFFVVGRFSMRSRQRQKAGNFGYIVAAFLGEAERERARQNVEVGEREFGAEQIILAMSQLALHHAEPELDLGQACATTFSSDAIPSSGKTSRSCVT